MLEKERVEKFVKKCPQTAKRMINDYEWMQKKTKDKKVLQQVTRDNENVAARVGIFTHPASPHTHSQNHTLIIKIMIIFLMISIIVMIIIIRRKRRKRKRRR